MTMIDAALKYAEANIPVETLGSDPTLATAYTAKRLIIELAVFQFAGKPSADKPQEFEGRALDTAFRP